MTPKERKKLRKGPSPGKKGEEAANVEETKNIFAKISGLLGGGPLGLMLTLCWNCRGLGDPATVHELHDLAQECALAILCMVETQIAKYRVEGLASTLGYDSAYGVSISGRSGGMCLY